MNLEDAVVVGLVLIAAGVFFFRQNVRRPRVDVTALEAAALNGPLTPIALHDVLVPLHGEVNYYDGPATFYGIKDIRHFQSGGGGVSVRLGRSPIRVFSGSRAGTSVNVPTMVRLDSGTFIITSHRIVGLAQKAAIEIPIHNLLSMEPRTDGVTVQAHGGRRLTIVTGNRIAGIVLGRILEKFVVAKA